MDHGFNHTHYQSHENLLDLRQSHALSRAFFFQKDTLEVIEDIERENEENSLLELDDYEAWGRTVLSLAGYQAQNIQGQPTHHQPLHRYT